MKKDLCMLINNKIMSLRNKITIALGSSYLTMGQNLFLISILIYTPAFSEIPIHKYTAN